MATYEDTFVGTSADGYLYMLGVPTWAGAWEPTIADWKDTTEDYVRVLTRLIDRVDPQPDEYYIYRGFLYFDTSSIPDDATITGVQLNLYGYDSSLYANSYSYIIQNGQPTYPHNPLVVDDYNKDYYSGDGGSIAGTWVNDAWNYVTLNADGISWVNKTGLTKFCIRTNLDIAGTPPSATSWPNIQIASRNYSLTYAPRLVVTYTLPTPPTVTTGNATNITYNSAELWGTLTISADYASNACGFQYGKTPSYGSTATSGTYTTSTDFGATLTGLEPMMVYYFRAYATYDSTTVYGDINYFITNFSTPDSKAGYIWVGGTKFRYLDSSGAKHAILGTPV